jgi:Acyclic terpene utilisation family protein AtuA
MTTGDTATHNSATGNKIVRIGGASGFWGDSSVGAPQLVASGQIDYLVFDYLAELTMSILAGARLKKPELGYATDFVSVAMKAVLKDVVAKGIRVVSNAGGVNPQGCADALAALAAEQGIDLKIAVVTGDDVMPLLSALREGADQGAAPVRELQSGAPLPPKVLTANAYLGAGPIKAALDAGAQVVITGRCVDSAVTLGVLMHEFGWGPADLDQLAAGSLAGHIIECGAQATGGLFTDWESVPDWAHIGYPIVECSADGSFICNKPAGTGGLVTPAVIAEQMLYEIGDPANYILPDVVCDFTQVQLEQLGDAAEHRVRVSGARGKPPTLSYKVCATYMDGFKLSAQLTIIGLDAKGKAQRTGEAILERTSELIEKAGWGPYTRTHIEVLGTESCFGPHAKAGGAREVIMRVTAMHPRKEALDLLAREVAPAGTSWSPGTTGSGGGRSSAAPSIKQFGFLLEKGRLNPKVHLNKTEIFLSENKSVSSHEYIQSIAISNDNRNVENAINISDEIETKLINIAHARSGDKGDISNIGVVARHPELVPVLREQLSEAAVAKYLAHLVKGKVTRYEVPGIHALNFVCEQALDGGGMASLRNDPLGKGMGQILLSMPVMVSKHLLGKVLRA